MSCDICGVGQILSLMAACVLTCDVMSVKSVEGKRMEKELEMKAERDTILAGIQATGSLGAFAMTGGMGAAAGTGSRQGKIISICCHRPSSNEEDRRKKLMYI